MLRSRTMWCGACLRGLAPTPSTSGPSLRKRYRRVIARTSLPRLLQTLKGLYSPHTRSPGHLAPPTSVPSTSCSPWLPMTNREPGSSTPTLDEYSRDLTQMAREGKLDPVIGRAEEVETTIEILSRRTKNNPVLIGDPGVGKTAIVEGIAQRVVNDEVPETLSGKRVMQLDLAGIVAGTQYRGQFEERLKKVIDEVRENSEDLILFIDELHTVVGAGAAEGAMDASNMLKPALARGELHVIGATTIEILRGLRDRYEAHHRVKISDEALVAAAELSDRYITGRFLPDKAIDLMDQAAARVRLRSKTKPKDTKALEDELRRVQREKDEAVAKEEFEKAPRLQGHRHPCKPAYRGGA